MMDVVREYNDHVASYPGAAPEIEVIGKTQDLPREGLGRALPGIKGGVLTGNSRLHEVEGDDGSRKRHVFHDLVHRGDIVQGVQRVGLAADVGRVDRRGSGVPAATASRSISPVAIWGTPHSRASSRSCVPLPAPGAPRNATRTP